MSPHPLTETDTGQQQINLLGFDRQALEHFFTSIGERAFRAQQLLQWLYQYGQSEFGAMTNFSKSLRDRLSAIAEIRLPEIVQDQLAIDGTRKWLIRLDDGNCIETVFIPEPDRGTLCVSSQVGCVLNCSFCSTASQGFNRNLEAAEIIAQIWLASRALRQKTQADRVITNVVMMGMGEPLANYDNVVMAMRIMLDDLAYGLSRRRVTLSTSGIVPMMDRLGDDCPVSLAVSLHAPDDSLRTELVPLNKKYPISELLAACKRYIAGRQREKVTFEYVMLAGVNDRPEHARQLVKCLKGIPAKVNLIPFNSFPGSNYIRSDDETINYFRDVLMRAGVMTVTRRPRGREIDAACGQLVGRFLDRTRRSNNNRNHPTAI